MTFIGHACFLFETDDARFIIDPFRIDSVPGLRLPSIEVDKAFVSHEHHDHNGIELLGYSGKKVHIDVEVIKTPHDHHNGEHRGFNKIHIFSIDKYRIAHVGDLGCIPSDEVIERLKNVDILLAPINGHYTISAMELYEICSLIKPKLVIPMHYEVKEKGIGYPDGGQIDEFKKLFPNYNEVNEDNILIEKSLFNKPALIFNKFKGEIE